jgi:hypothetical protein
MTDDRLEEHAGLAAAVLVQAKHLGDTLQFPLIDLLPAFGADTAADEAQGVKQDDLAAALLGQADGIAFGAAGSFAAVDGHENCLDSWQFHICFLRKCLNWSTNQFVTRLTRSVKRIFQRPRLGRKEGVIHTPSRRSRLPPQRRCAMVRAA